MRNFALRGRYLFIYDVAATAVAIVLAFLLRFDLASFPASLEQALPAGLVPLIAMPAVFVAFGAALTLAGAARDMVGSRARNSPARAMRVFIRILSLMVVLRETTAVTAASPTWIGQACRGGSASPVRRYASAESRREHGR